MFVMTSIYCLAESFDLNKFKQLKDKKETEKLLKYCAQSTPTEIGIQNKQHLYAIKYFTKDENVKFTKEQVLSMVKPFVNVAKNDKTKNMIQFYGLQSAKLYENSNLKAKQIYANYKIKLPYGVIANRFIANKDYKSALQLANKYNLIMIKLKVAKINKDNQMIWNISKNILCYKSGVKNVNKATQILIDMYRYKPQSVTKQQQILFLQQLQKIYPVAGTNFQQWKPFIKVIYFKHKNLSK